MKKYDPWRKPPCGFCSEPEFTTLQGVSLCRGHKDRVEIRFRAIAYNARGERVMFRTTEPTSHDIREWARFRG